jgi:TonB-dependent receptor
MTGAKIRLTTHDVENDNSAQWTYVGPGGTLASQTSAVFPIHQVMNFDPKVGGNMTQLNLPYVDPTKLRDIYVAHPDWFIPDTVGNFRTALTAPRGLKEQVDAYFAETSTRLNKLRFNLGARHERTRTVGKVFEIIPAAKIPAVYTPNTIPYISYQYSRGRQNQYGEYGNWFFSGGAKYEFTRNFVLQVSAAQSILRPSYDNLAGVITIDDTTKRASVPNPNLKPETSDKYFVSLQYYLEPAGTVSVSAYELNIKNLSSTARRLVSPAEAGYGDDPLYADYTFSQVINVPGTQKMKGVDVEYSQQLVFLPGFWRGFSVFGSVSRTVSELQLIGVVPKAANGGIRFGNHKFNLQVRGTWQSAKIDGFATNEVRWQAERFLVDVSGGYKFNRTYELTLAGRNITDAFQDYYSNQPGLLRSREILGPIWTLGVRGRF